jgi:GNAT superfamily N-acetyltransferase
MQIRTIQPEDLDAFTRMVTNYDPKVTEQRLARTWYRFFAADPAAYCLVAVEDDQPVAFMTFAMHDFPFASQPTCYMDALYTQPEYRGRGIARALIAYLADFGRIMNWGRIYWCTELNNPARKMYDEIAGAPRFVRYTLDL